MRMYACAVKADADLAFDCRQPSAANAQPRDYSPAHNPCCCHRRNFCDPSVRNCCCFHHRWSQVAFEANCYRVCWWPSRKLPPAPPRSQQQAQKSKNLIKLPIRLNVGALYGCSTQRVPTSWPPKCLHKYARTHTLTHTPNNAQLVQFIGNVTPRRRERRVAGYGATLNLRCWEPICGMVGIATWRNGSKCQHSNAVDNAEWMNWTQAPIAIKCRRADVKRELERDAVIGTLLIAVWRRWWRWWLT